MKAAEILAWEQAVREAYTRQAQRSRVKHWEIRFDFGYILGKLLTDYTLLGRLDLAGRTVLNVGCCEPIDEFYFAARVGRWFALDINPDVLQQARALLAADLSGELFRRLEFVTGDAAALPFPDASFDVVVSFSTIDHIPSPEARWRSIDELCRVVKPGGHLVLTLPNKLNWYEVTYTWLGRRRRSLAYGYAVCFWPWQVRAALRRNGMRTLEFTSSAFNPHTSRLDWLLRRTRLAMLKKWMGGRMGFLAQRTA